MYKIIGADGREYGPVDANQLRQWITEGRVNTDTQVLPEGGGEWKPLRALPDFSSFTTHPTTPPPIRPGPNQLTRTTPQTNSPFAVAGLILGIVSLTFGLCCCYGLPFNLLGIVFSLVGLVQIQQHPDVYSGRGLAVTGLLCSIVSLTLAVVLMTIGLAMSWHQFPAPWKRL